MNPEIWTSSPTQFYSQLKLNPVRVVRTSREFVLCVVTQKFPLRIPASLMHVFQICCSREKRMLESRILAPKCFFSECRIHHYQNLFTWSHLNTKEIKLWWELMEIWWPSNGLITVGKTSFSLGMNSLLNYWLLICMQNILNIICCYCNGVVCTNSLHLKILIEVKSLISAGLLPWTWTVFFNLGSFI